jgi:pimeloyl-ACP methyl ester carboxylesterase
LNRECVDFVDNVRVQHVRVEPFLKRLGLVAALAAAICARPCAAEDLTWSSGGVTLSGTLTLPTEPHKAPFRAIVLISGSGAQNRDSEVFGFKLFAVLADHLTRHGVAVLRYDDRGVGGSTGRLATSTLRDLAGDVVAAVTLLAKRADIDARRLGVLGHSQGAHVAALAAAASPDISFLVLAAPPARPGSDILRRQQTDSALALGATAEQAALVQAAFAKVLEAIRTNASQPVLEAALRQHISAQLEARSPGASALLGDKQALVEQFLPRALAQLRAPAMRELIDFDPVPAFRELNRPILAIFGGKDVQVPPDEHRPAFEAAFSDPGRLRPTVLTYPDANHLFQAATTGRPDEYASLPREFVPGLLDAVTRWVTSTR